MVEMIYSINGKINDIVWGPYMAFLLVGVGIFMTIRLNFIQFGKFKYIWKNTIGKAFDKSEGAGSISSAKAGLTSIAAVVGTGNIAGVATAVAIGGPGAVFWMWVSALFGMQQNFLKSHLVSISERKKRMVLMQVVPCTISSKVCIQNSWQVSLLL